MVDVRTELINSARGLAKPMGERLKKCDADGVKKSLTEGMEEEVQAVIGPLLKSVEEISNRSESTTRKSRG